MDFYSLSSRGVSKGFSLLDYIIAEWLSNIDKKILDSIKAFNNQRWMTLSIFLYKKKYKERKKVGSKKACLNFELMKSYWPCKQPLTHWTFKKHILYFLKIMFPPWIVSPFLKKLCITKGKLFKFFALLKLLV